MSSSGTVTPRTASATPIPPSVGGGGGDPAPLTIGTRFVKQYYHEISTSPELIVRFYQPSTSVVTVGTGSDPATDVTVDLAESAAARFHENDGPVRFEFEHGAIDAQLSMNGGVLLVVTGQMISSQTKKSFVHTFFLGVTSAGSNSSKKSYFIHNDILRFLYQEENGTGMEAPTVVVEANENEIEDSDELAVAPSLPVEEAFANQTALVDDLDETAGIPPVLIETVHPTILDKPDEIIMTTTAAAATVGVAAPGHGVEESKEAILADEDDTAAPLMAATTQSKQTTPAPPGSWASLVARKTATLTPPSTPNRPIDKTNGSTNTAGSSGTTATTSHQSSTPVKAKAETSNPASNTALAAAAAAVSTSTTAAHTSVPSSSVAPLDSIANSNSSKTNVQSFTRQNKRDPDCTLVIKNIDGNATEAEILGLFAPFTADSTGKVMGCTVQAHRGIAFVDYDSPEPVLKAVAQQTDVAPFVIRDRKLEIYQKTVEQRSRGPNASGGRGSGRGGYRGGGGRDYRNSSSNNSGDDRGDFGGGRGGGGSSSGRYVRRGEGNRSHGGGGRGVGSGRNGSVGTATAATTGGR